MRSIEEEVQRWTEEQRRTGREVYQILRPRLREILLRGYSTLDPSIKAISNEVFTAELEKFTYVVQGELNANYFKQQGDIAKSVAKTVSYVQYLCPGYATYAYELIATLLQETRWVGKKRRNDLLRSLLRSIFVEVSVAMHHFFAEITQEAEAQRREFDRQRDAAARADRNAVATFETALEALANGDLSFRIQDTAMGKSETATNFNSAAAALMDAMATIRLTSTDIEAATQLIADATDKVSVRTEQQAAALEETASSLEQFAEAVRQTSVKAELANKVTTEARSDAECSRDVMTQAIEAMKDIETSSGEISQIVAVIDEIAFQTNLLALNAGVEAARAGEAGKGFAVVASEVRALAQRSAEAAKQIRGLIRSSDAQVKRGVSLVSTTGKTLGGIVQKVADVDDLISGIAASATHQASSIQHINVAINQMDDNTQRNAAMMEETHAATADLRVKAEHLQELVVGFKLSPKAGAFSRKANDRAA